LASRSSMQHGGVSESSLPNGPAQDQEPMVRRRCRFPVFAASVHYVEVSPSYYKWRGTAVRKSIILYAVVLTILSLAFWSNFSSKRTITEVRSAVAPYGWEACQPLVALSSIAKFYSATSGIA